MNKLVEISEKERERQHQAIADAIQAMGIINESPKGQEGAKPKEEKSSRVEKLIKEIGL